ncbi:MAG TPA: hypothetical protein VH724_08305, partial [Candidatus Angelobacter sp.]|nr:hypothetical protein [Candidatus Angelobacter sp.]
SWLRDRRSRPEADANSVSAVLARSLTTQSLRIAARTRRLAGVFLLGCMSVSMAAQTVPRTIH